MGIRPLFPSFRDPSGFVYLKNNKIFRQINLIYKNNYEFLMGSGLYNKLIEEGILIPHKEVRLFKKPANAYKIIEPQIIPFISYPYEWCFSQLKDAALLTLRAQKKALGYGMSLKDANSFNIQYLDGKPVLLDTLSFEKYEEGKPWTAYRQFCEQFLAPLALFAYRDIRLNRLLQTSEASLPLDLTANLLPISAKIKLPLLLHLVLHERSQRKYAKTFLKQKATKLMRRGALLELIQNLEEGIKALRLKSEKTIWTEYGRLCPSYSEETTARKKYLVDRYLQIVRPKSVWDIGANTGTYSRIASTKGIFTVSLDSDHSVVEENYLKIKREAEKNILPLWVDIVNPTPSIGWENRERDAFLLRRRPEAVFALALIHHLAVGNNLPLSMLAQFFANTSQSLIIEFVPKEDPQAQILLQSREDIFANYNRESFEKEFGKFFSIKEREILPRSKRSLYLMVKKGKHGKA